MPLYESACQSPACDVRGMVFEWLGKFDSPEPECGWCGTPTVRQVSRFGIVWTGYLSGKYNDKNAEGGEQDGAHWAWRTKTKSGKPEPVLIETFSDQKKFCEMEGLSRPQDCCGAANISADGKSLLPVGVKEAREFREHSNHVAEIAAKQEAAG